MVIPPQLSFALFVLCLIVFLLTNTVEWIIWISNTKSSWKKSDGEHDIMDSLKQSTWWLSSLRLVSHPVGQMQQLWQIWCLLWKRVRDVFMCLVFLWLNLFFSYFWRRHNYDVHRMDTTKTNNKCVWSGLAVCWNQSPDHHTQRSLFLWKQRVRRKIIKKGKRRKTGFRVGGARGLNNGFSTQEWT